MINHILLICFSIFTYEFIRFIKFKEIIKSNLKTYKKIFKLFKLKNVSDFRKEKLVLNYSRSLFVISIKIFLILSLIITFMIILNLVSETFFDSIFSILSIIELSIVVMIYHQFRKNNARSCKNFCVLL